MKQFSGKQPRLSVTITSVKIFAIWEGENKVLWILGVHVVQVARWTWTHIHVVNKDMTAAYKSTPETRDHVA